MLGSILKVCTFNDNKPLLSLSHWYEKRRSHTSANISTLAERYRCPKGSADSHSPNFYKKDTEPRSSTHLHSDLNNIWSSSGCHCVCFYKSAYNIQMFTLQSLGPGLGPTRRQISFPFYPPVEQMESGWIHRVADVFHVLHFTRADKKNLTSLSTDGWNWLDCIEHIESTGDSYRWLRASPSVAWA